MDIKKIKPFLSIASVLISGLSLTLAVKSLAKSESQFENTSQGYLEADVTVKVNKYKDNVKEDSILSDLSRFAGLSFFAKLTNVGNLPIEYRIRYIDILLGGQKIGNINNETAREGLLYPKQEYEIRVPAVYIQNDNILTMSSLSGKIFIVRLFIEYNDIESSHTKKVDRVIEFEPHKPAFVFYITKFGDKI